MVLFSRKTKTTKTKTKDECNVVSERIYPIIGTDGHAFARQTARGIK